MNTQIQNIAISCDENEHGVVIYQAYVFMAPPDYRVIKLDPHKSLEAAQKSVEDFLEMLVKIKSKMEESDRINEVH